MMKTILRTSAFLSVLLIFTGLASAQVPGDGIPDVYYFQDGLLGPDSVDTSFGVITRPAGTMTVDTDGADMIAIFVTGPDVSLPPACLLCEAMHLPIDDLTNVAKFTVGFSPPPPAGPPGSTQWIRNDPLSGRGFIGVIGTGYVDGSGATINNWPADFLPFVDYPDLGLATLDGNLTQDDFPQLLNDPTGGLWSVQMAPDVGDSLFTNVTVVPGIVPEPGSMSLFGMALLGLFGLRRRS